MKKKRLRKVLFLFFVIGVVIGLFIPTDKIKEKFNSGVNPVKPNIYDIPKKFGQLDIDAGSFKYTVIDEATTGSAGLFRVDDEIPTHTHPKENHYVYIYRGKAIITIGDSNSEVNAGQLIAIPSGAPHNLKRIGDSPVEFILFSTPPFKEKDINWIKQE